MSDNALTGSTLIAAWGNTNSPSNIQGPASSLAGSTLLELAANGELILAGGSDNRRRFAELGSANNPSGRSGIIKINTPSGRLFGYILPHSTHEGGRATKVP